MPLADFFPRRKFTLVLITFTMLFWLGLCVTRDLTVFLVLSYLSAVCTGIPQIMMPLVSELSTDANRATNISIVAMGPTLAILLARILSGIVANWVSWRYVYWMAFGFQGSVLIALWLFMPDYPATNPIKIKKLVKSYPKILWSIVCLYPKYPPLVQAGLMSFCTFFAVGSFWTTLTFLLEGEPYNYTTYAIGLFGLIGAATMIMGPVYGKYIVQPLGPTYSALIGKIVNIIAVVIGTFVGRHNVAGPVLQALLLDAGLMIVQIANRIAIHPCEPKGRNRVNTAFICLLYGGMLAGTKAGNVIYQDHGGWLASGGLSLGILILSIGIIVMRGPNETRWFGWRGGWRLQKKTEEGKTGDVEEGIEKQQEVHATISPTEPVVEKDDTSVSDTEKDDTVSVKDDKSKSVQ